MARVRSLEEVKREMKFINNPTERARARAALNGEAETIICGLIY